MKEDIAVLRELSGSKKYEEALSGLEADLDVFVDVCEERIQELEGGISSTREVFELRLRQLTGVLEEFTALARKKPDQPHNAL